MNKEKEIDCAPQMTTYMVPHEKKRHKKADTKQKNRTRGSATKRERADTCAHNRVCANIKVGRL